MVPISVFPLEIPYAPIVTCTPHGVGEPLSLYTASVPNALASFRGTTTRPCDNGIESDEGSFGCPAERGGRAGMWSIGLLHQQGSSTA